MDMAKNLWPSLCIFWNNVINHILKFDNFSLICIKFTLSNYILIRFYEQN